MDARVAAKMARSICSARLGDCADMAFGPAMTGTGPTAAAVGVLVAGDPCAPGPVAGAAGGGGDARPLADARTGDLRMFRPVCGRRCGGGWEAGWRTGMTGALKDLDALVEDAWSSRLDRTGADAPCGGSVGCKVSVPRGDAMAPEEERNGWVMVPDDAEEA